MEVTTVTLATGERLAVAGSYEDTASYLRARGADGLREVALADGTRATIATGAIATIREGEATINRGVGFAAALERYGGAA